MGVFKGNHQIDFVGRYLIHAFGRAARLFDAVQRYTDGLKVAAEQLLGSKIVHTLDGLAEQLIPELASEPSWPSLRAHLLALGAETGEHPGTVGKTVELAGLIREETDHD